MVQYRSDGCRQTNRDVVPRLGLLDHQRVLLCHDLLAFYNLCAVGLLDRYGWPCTGFVLKLTHDARFHQHLNTVILAPIYFFTANRGWWGVTGDVPTYVPVSWLLSRRSFPASWHHVFWASFALIGQRSMRSIIFFGILLLPNFFWALWNSHSRYTRDRSIPLWLLSIGLLDR